MSGLGVSQKESKEERRGDKKKTDKPARSRSKSPKVPKNIWSPGSTTTTTSSTEDTTAASPTSRSRRSKKKTVQTYSHSTQTTPTKVPNHSGSGTMVMSCTTTPTPVGGMGSWHLPSTTPSSSRETVVTTIPTAKSKKQPRKQAEQSEQREQPSQQPSDTKATKSDEEATEEDLIPRVPSSSPVEEEEDNNNNNNGDNVEIIDPLADRDILSPSSLSEISLGETTTGGKPTGSVIEGGPPGPAGYTPPSSPQLRQAAEPASETSREKYWTLPRRGGEGGGDADDEDEEIVLTKTAKSREPPTTKYSTLPSGSSSITTGHHHHHIQRHHPHHPPPSSSQSGVPMSSSQQLPLSSRQTSSLRPSSAYSIPSKPSSAPSSGPSTTQPKTQATAIKYAGIGPVEEGVPLASRPQVREEFASDWYKTMYKRLHTLPRPKGGVRKEDEPIRIRYKTRRPREYRFDANYFSDDEATIPRPRHISEFVTGSSSITEREKQMFYAEVINYIDSIFADVFKSSAIRQQRSGVSDRPRTAGDEPYIISTQEERARIQRELDMAASRAAESDRVKRTAATTSDHDKTCVFSALTQSSHGGGEGDFIYRKTGEKPSEPASRSTYIAVQKGDSDIPLTGLQKPAPQRRAVEQQPLSNKKATRQFIQPKKTLSQPSLLPSSSAAYSSPPSFGIVSFEEPEQQPQHQTEQQKPMTMAAAATIDDKMMTSSSNMKFEYMNANMNYSSSNMTKESTPIRPPPPFSSESIDDWQKKVNEDFNRLYHNLYNSSPKPWGGSTRSLSTPPARPPPPLPEVSGSNPSGGNPGHLTVPEVVITDVKNNRKIEKIDKIERKEHIFGGAKDDKSWTIPIERESPHQFAEGDVTIHYRTPVRQLHPSEQFPLTQPTRSYAPDHHRGRSTSKERDMTRHHFTPSRDIPVDTYRYQRAYEHEDFRQYARIQLARVLYDFHAQSPRELSVKKGDILILRRPIDHNWLEVEDSQSGLKGMVPRNYLDCQQEGTARAKFDFEAKTPVEMELKKGDHLRLVRKVDDNWYEGINVRGQMGIFPCSYVETIKQPIYLQLNNNLYSSSPSPTPYSSDYRPSDVSSSRPTSPAVAGVARPHSMPQFSSGNRDRSDVRNYSASTGVPATSSSSQPAKTVLGQKLYRVIYPYRPQQADELELVVGDILTVTMKCDDGWYVGHSTLSGNYGTFPGNYVQPIGQ